MSVTIEATLDKIPTFFDQEALGQRIDNVGEMLDKVAELDAEMDALRATIQPQLDELARQKAELLEAFESLVTDAQSLPAEDDEKKTYSGRIFKMDVGARSSKRAISDIKAAAAALGDDIFWRIANIAFKDLDKYVAPAAQADFVSVTRGDRNIKVSRIK